MRKRTNSNLRGFEALESKRMFTGNMDFVPVDPTIEVAQESEGVIILGDYFSIRGNGSEGIRGSGSEVGRGLMSTGIPLPSVAEARPNSLQDIIAILGAQAPQEQYVDAAISTFDA